ncbi:hypothetical protein [Chitinophaga sp. RAB17]|uniref:hypothetical protein n=1 Tax=Chitinophaga sp. RAB17 TaxID=3233049 RepID=UPI003F92E587
MKSVVNYFNLIGEFTNPATFIWGAILTGLLAFIVALVLVILLRKHILIDRSHKVLRFIAYTYFILLPLLAGFFGFKWGFFNSVRKDIKTHAGVYAKHVPSVFDEQANSAVQSLFASKEGDASSITGMTSNQLIDTVGVLVYNVYGKTLEQRAALDGVQGKLAAFMLRTTKGAGVAFLIRKYITKLLTEKLGLHEEVSNELMQKEIASIINGGLFVNIALIQVDHFLKGLQKGVLITFLLIFAIPCIEIGVAHYLHRKRIKAVPQPVTV